MTLNRKLVITEDGSHTLLVEGLNEHYHSTHGAVQESMHVYIKHGLSPLLQQGNPIHIFEMGFGTGLNALLTILQAGDTPIHYTSLEAYPLTETEIATLNYPHQIQDPRATQYFQQIHAAAWDAPVQLTPTFTLHKVQGKLADFDLPKQSVNLVYFDAFAPSIQPELWSHEILTKVTSWLQPNGIFVTYSAKGGLKRSLAALGFTVTNPPGPPGKKEITQGVK